MVSYGALLLPIILSAVLVFIVSSLVHMVLGYHAADYNKLPNEDAVRTALRESGAKPAQYIIPHCTPAEMKSPEYKQKIVEGPIAVLNLKPAGDVGMGKALGQWFVFALLTSAMVAYVAAAALPAGTPYLKVFQVAGATAWVAYAFGQVPAAAGGSRQHRAW